MSKARPRLLVVNADDLGRTEGINEGIFDAHERGIVSSATLMVGFAAAAKAAVALADHPRLGVGLHVTLTGAAPTLPASRVPSLVGADARFPAKPESIREPDPAELRAEVRNQLDIFRDLVHRDPTHIDSHHHSHRHPVVLDAMIELATTHRLPIRASSPAVAAALRGAGIATTDVFVERFFADEARRDVLFSIFDELAPGSTELMCHPARVDDELRSSSSYAEPRARELEVLTDPAVRRELAERGIRLARFDEACAS
jgi:chitin disaccharide deacetylase